MLKRLHFLLLLVPMIVACDPGKNENTFNNNNTNNNTTTNNAQCVEGSRTCSFNSIVTCVGGQWQYNEACGTGALAPICDPNNGSPRCVDCYPGGTVCGDGDNAIHSCNSDGTVGLVTETCDTAEGEECININQNAQCDSPCIRAANTKSYRGCEYYLAAMANPGLGGVYDDWTGELVQQTTFDSDFGVAVDNTMNSVQNHVVIKLGSQTLVDDYVQANQLRVFTLPYNLATRQAGSGPTGIHEDISSGIYYNMANEGAYYLTTTLPATVYQFNPYNFEISGTFTYSNDASLILPVAVLSKNYIVMSRPTLAITDGSAIGDAMPGTVTIVATDNNTTVTVNSKAYTRGGSNVAALSPNGTGTYTLNQGDVLQFSSGTPTSHSDCAESSQDPLQGYYYCMPNENYDLTGSEITADKPIAVWGGHSGTFIPYDSWAFDHIEEMIFPLETWGKHFYVGLTKQIEQGSIESNIVKILSGDNNVTVTFNPSSIHSSVTLNKGEYLEFMAPVNTDFEINSTGPILVGKFMLGQNYWTDSNDAMGDPAFGLVVPVEQYRSDYSFATPTSMTENWVNVIAVIPSDNTGNITLDGQLIPPSSFLPIGDTGWGVAKVEVTNSGSNGAHTISSDDDDVTFGIEVYGFASYTSYLYPGGLDLEYINPVE